MAILFEPVSNAGGFSPRDLRHIEIRRSAGMRASEVSRFVLDFFDRLGQKKKTSHKASILSPDPPRVPAVMTVPASIPNRSRAPGQASDDSTLGVARAP